MLVFEEVVESGLLGSLAPQSQPMVPVVRWTVRGGKVKRVLVEVE